MLFRKIIHISAEHSPNVRIAKARIAAGIEGPHPTIVPGVVSYADYLRRMETWDPVKRTIRLFGQFYEGAEVLLFPVQWLDRAEAISRDWTDSKISVRRTMGVDAAEGNDSTVWTICEPRRIVHQLALKTHNTDDIPGRTLALMREFNVSAENVLFDRGGGGKQHADRMRGMGHRVRTVGFGEPATQLIDEKSRAVTTRTKENEMLETRYIYKNRRAEMYGLTRLKLDPEENPEGFGIPEHLQEMRRQMSLMPLLYDPEGRMYLPPKRKADPNSNKSSLKEIIGCSPDECDSLVLAVFGQVHPAKVIKAGAAF